jgi:multiple sugar transport system permease protein
MKKNDGSIAPLQRGGKFFVRTHRLFLYTLIVIGGIVFSFPFYWMLVTSFKSDSEIMATSPQWFPAIPVNVERSPYLLSGVDVAEPPGVTEEVWSKTLPVLEQYVWSAIVLRMDSSEHRRLLQASLPDSSWEGQMAMVAGDRWNAWKRQMIHAVLKRAMPSAAVAGDEPLSSEQLLGTVVNRVTPEEIQRTFANTYRTFALGRLTVQDVRRFTFNFYNMSPNGAEAWRFQPTETTCPVSRLILERESAIEVPYSLKGDSKIIMSYSGTLPVPIDEIDNISLVLHGDASYNKVNLVVETAGRVYVSNEDFLLDTYTWKTAVWAFGPAQQGQVLPSVRLVRDTTSVSSVNDMGRVKLSVLISKSSHVHTILEKFTASYRELIGYFPFLTYLRNTIILLLLNIFAQVFASSFVAYGLSRIRWPGRHLVFVVILSTVMLPGQVTMIPQFLIWKELGMYNTWLPLWLPSLFGSAFNIFLLRQFFMTLPKDIEDAARIDGCGYFGTYWRIMLPQIKPALAAIAVFQFMGTWNNFMGPLIYISSDHLAPLALGVYTLQTVHRTAWAMLMAAAALMALPTILVFLFAQKYFIKGVTFTGIKG